ncbi:MAG: tetratricopeptide repeat protein [Alphaproteobacteria bacterium]
MPTPAPLVNEDIERQLGLVEEIPEEAEIQNILPPEDVPVPDQGNLAAPQPADQALSPVAQEGITEDDVFYDADVLVPEGELARTAPRKVDPRVEPASKLIIVKKNAGANSRQAQLVAASRAVKLGRYSSALEIYNDLYRKNKRDPNILMGRAVALQKLGLMEEAIMAYEELLEIRPKNVEAHINMLGLISEQFPAVALRQLKDLRQRYPDNVGLVAQIAITEARIGNYDSAIRYMGVAASMEPENANHYFNLAVIADRAGVNEDAVRYYEKALEVDTIYGGNRTVPRDQIYTRLAQIR